MDAENVLDGIRAAADGGEGIRCLRLLRLDSTVFSTIRSEVLSLCMTRVPSVVTEGGHVTGWVLPYGEVLQYSLLNSTGRTEDFSEDHQLAGHRKCFVARAECPTLARLVDDLPDLVNVRVAVLGPGAGLSPHQEQVFIRAPDGSVVPRVRCHLPVQSAEAATLVLDGRVVHLAEGFVHLVNHGCVHAASNRSDRPRVHVMWDQVLTADVFELLFGRGPVGAPFTRVTEAQEVEPLAQVRVPAARRLPRQVPEPDLRAAGLAHPQWWVFAP